MRLAGCPPNRSKGMITNLWLVLAFAFSSQCLSAPFRNLDFQSPNTAALQGPSVNTADAIPGWELLRGDQPQSQLLYNGFCQTCPGASLYGPENPKPGDTFSFGIYGGLSPIEPELGFLSESAFQTGDIPNDTQSLQFVANVGPSRDLLRVFLGGQELQLHQFEPVGFGYRFGADIASWAGATAELRFTIEPGDGSFIFGSVGLDNIRFSNVPLVPEPSAWALLGMGLAALGWVLRRK